MVDQAAAGRTSAAAFGLPSGLVVTMILEMIDNGFLTPTEQFGHLICLFIARAIAKPSTRRV
jgi:hypothetical protein